jgi:hypothetical protein
LIIKPDGYTVFRFHCPQFYDEGGPGMNRFNRKKNRNLIAYPSLAIGLICIISLTLMPHFKGPAEARNGEKEKPELNVFNPVGTAIGSVDEAGSVYNRLGRLIGSVDPKGTIYNITNNPIGKVEADGKVFNRLGKLVGSVDDEGNVFNNNGRKIGSVKPPVPGNIILIGGAAWLLLLGVR